MLIAFGQIYCETLVNLALIRVIMLCDFEFWYAENSFVFERFKTASTNEITIWQH